MKYCVLDLETGTKEYLGQKASYCINPIVAVGIKYQGSHVTSHYGIDSTENYLKDLFCNTSIDILIGHNIAFDLLYLWKFEFFQDWLIKGGKIFDTQLAEYILTGQRHKYPALRDIAVNKYGCKEREKLMEKYWEQGVDTQDIPKELVIQDVEQDVLDTEKVMLKQLKLARQEGQYTLIMSQMDSVLATIEMRYNGIYLNKEILEKNKATIENEIENLNSLITSKVNFMPDFNPKSPSQLSVLFFGGLIKEDVQVPVLNELGVHQQYKTGANRGQYKYKKEVREVYVKGLGLTPRPDWETKKLGIYQTNESILNTLSNNKKIKGAAELARLMLEKRQKEKLLSSYYTGFEKYMNDKNLIHPHFSHCGYEKTDGSYGGGTQTGRLSCIKPAAQTIPRG